MRIESPLAGVVEVLEEVRQVALANRRSLGSSEAATRAALIDPILRCLGWNIENPNMVEVEKSLPHARIDYLLLDADAKPSLVVEAKALGKDLAGDEILISLFSYAVKAEVLDVILTDGVAWLHFDDFDLKNVGPRKTLNLTSSDLVQVASYLVEILDAARYWPEAMGVDELAIQLSAVQSTVSSLQKEFERSKSGKPGGKGQAEGPSGVGISSPSKLNLVPLLEIEDATRTKPSQYQLPDGTLLAVSSWSEILLESVKFVLEVVPDLAVPFGDKAAGDVNLIATIRPPKSISSTEVEHGGEPVFVRTNYSANGCIENALHILELIPPEHVEVEPAVQYS